METEENTTVSQIADLARAGVAPQLVSLKRPAPGGDEAVALITAEGHEASSIKHLLDEYRTAPERRRGTASFEALESFCAHVTRFRDDHTVIFAQRNPPGLLAVLDYHESGAAGSPRFGEHRSKYAFPLSDEWKAWLAVNGSAKAFGQAGFAEFLETRLVDVRDPSAAGDQTMKRLADISATAAPPWKLLGLSRGLQIKAGVSVQNAVNLSSGETQIEFVTQHQDATGKALEVPGAFVIAIPVFQRGELYEIPVRLRYRLREGVISWWFDLLAHEAVFEDAFRRACAEAVEKTAVPLLFGTPEA